MAETNTGMWLDHALRTGLVGTWWSASTASGQPLGLLRLEPGLIAATGVQDRLAAAVTAVRAANPRGVLRTTELVVDARRAWLVVAARPTPTVDDLLAAGPPLAPGAAAAIAVDVAEALRDLHAVGISHGDLAVDTVVLTSGGAATLVEVGVLAAVRDRPTDIDADVRAWSGLAWQLASVAGDRAEVDLLHRAAKIAESGDLATAARRLAAGAGHLADFADRESLVAALPALAGHATDEPRVPRQRSTVDEMASSPVRIRFGRGVSEAAIVAAVTSEPRRRPLRALRIAALVMASLLAAGAALLSVLVFG